MTTFLQLPNGTYLNLAHVVQVLESTYGIAFQMSDGGGPVVVPEVDPEKRHLAYLALGSVLERGAVRIIGWMI